LERWGISILLQPKAFILLGATDVLFISRELAISMIICLQRTNAIFFWFKWAMKNAGTGTGYDFTTNWHLLACMS
jgi:hypothetical protein